MARPIIAAGVSFLSIKARSPPNIWKTKALAAIAEKATQHKQKEQRLIKSLSLCFSSLCKRNL